MQAPLKLYSARPGETWLNFGCSVRPPLVQEVGTRGGSAWAMFAGKPAIISNDMNAYRIFALLDQWVGAVTARIRVC
jgi:hypothetical protein